MSMIANFELGANEDMLNRFNELKEEINEHNIREQINNYNEELEDLKSQLDSKNEELNEIKNDIEDINDNIENITEQLQPLNDIIEEYDALKSELKHIGWLK